MMNRVVRDRGNDAERSERVTCDEVSGRISSYIDGELSRCVSEKVSEHIRSCERCRREYEELVGIDVALRESLRLELPGDFARSVAAAARSMPAAMTRPGVAARMRSSLRAFLEEFFDLLGPAASPGTGALDEFNDVPASFIGYAYFRALGR